MSSTQLPDIVSPADWRAELEALREAEKAATRARDALAARRRRMPMTPVEKNYRFLSEHGEVGLIDLFEGRRQLLIYHFMFARGVHGWPDSGCPGCSWFVDGLTHPAHLHARDTSITLVSLAPLETLNAYKARMGWILPWVSSAGSEFNADFGVSTDAGETFGLSALLRDGSKIYRTYFTNGRGCEALGSHWTLLDLTAYGRQETWEDSPEGWPQSEPYVWWRRHDEY